MNKLPEHGDYSTEAESTLRLGGAPGVCFGVRFLVVAFTMAVHGFRNPLLVLLGIIGTVMLTSFLLSMTAAMFGLLPGVPA